MADTLFDGIFAGANGVAKILTDELGGVTGTLDTKVPGTYNEATDTQIAGSTTSMPVTASPLLQYQIKEIDGTNIKKDDNFILVSAVEVTSAIVNNLTTYTMTEGSQKFTVVNHKPIYSGNSIAEYKIQLRR